jgi:beta-glucosidase
LSSVAVVVVSDQEAERHDRTTLALPGNQDALVAAVAAANRRTIVVLETGSAVLMPWIKSVPAVLETWYPGATAGLALADLLSGKVDPSGKLPVTFPASESVTAMPDATPATFGGTNGQVLYSDDINVGYRWYQTNQVQPLFPFGYGLSYTTFKFSGLQTTITSSGGIDVQATITNTGPARGTEVVQAYLGMPSDAGEPPRQLRGFTRVDLASKQSKTVQMTIAAGDLATWDSGANSWVVPGGTYTVYVGDGSDLAHLPLADTVQVAPASLGADSGPTHHKG